MSKKRTLESVAKSPDQKRALATINHVSEGMFDVVSTIDLVEAVSWLATEKDRIHVSANRRFCNIISSVLAESELYVLESKL